PYTTLFRSNRPGASSNDASPFPSGLPRDDEVSPPPEAVDDPIEVAFAQAVPLFWRDAGVLAFLMALQRKAGQLQGASGIHCHPFVAQDEAPPDIQIAIEPEMLVERPAVDVIGAPEPLDVAFDGVDVSGGGLLEVP